MDYAKLANRIFSKDGWTSLIFIAGNIIVVAWIVSLITKDLNGIMCILIAIGLQIVNTIFILSPVGEYVLRVYSKGRKIRSNEINDILSPLFEEVYSRAKVANPNLQDGIKLYIKNHDSINAFAIGRKTILINTGILDLDPEIIKGILGHEMGHLSNQDTVVTNLIMGGNVFVSGTLAVLGKIMEFVVAVTGVGTIRNRTGKETKDSWLALFVNTVLFGIINLAIRAWTLFGGLTFAKMMRQDEYNADAFSTRLGYGEGLIALFSTGKKEKPDGLIAAIERWHPTNYDRVEAMKKILNEELDLRKTGNDFNVVPIENKKIDKEKGSDKDSIKEEKPDESIANPKAALTDKEIEINNKKHTCPNCGYEIQEGSKFCPHCGLELNSIVERRCPDCGYVAKNDDELFCPLCGKPLQEYNLFKDVEEEVENSSEEQIEDDKQTVAKHEEKVGVIDKEIYDASEKTEPSESYRTAQDSTGDRTVALLIVAIIVGVTIIIGGILFLNYINDYEEDTYYDETTYLEETEDPEDIAEEMVDLNQDIKIKVTADTVNIRLYPSNDSEVVAQVEKGYVLKPTVENDEWYGVEYGGTTNYIKKELVEILQETTTQQSYRIIRYKKCFTGTELRVKPDIGSKVITKIPTGNKVGIIEEGFYDDDKDEWYKVSYNGKVGYAEAFMINM